MSDRRQRRKGVVIHLCSQAFGPASHPGVFRMVKGLSGRFAQVVLCTERAGYADVPLSSGTRAELEAEAIRVHTLEPATLRKAFPPRLLLAGIRGASGVPVAVVAHLGKNAFRALGLGCVADVPILGIFHGEDANVELHHPDYRENFARWFSSPGAVALGVAENLTQKLIAAGFPSDRAATHHLGIDLPSYAPRPPHRGSGPLRIVMSGRLIPVKEHGSALEALAILRREVPGSELHLFGEGPLEAVLRSQAKTLGVGEGVHFRGAVPVDELAQELQLADVVLQPSAVDADGREEGVPNSILEAMASAVPVIATRHGGIPEAVRDGETGRLVGERAPEELASALREACDPALRERWGQAARQFIEAEFDQARQGERLARRIEAARSDYLSIPASDRREAWEHSVTGYVELASAIGRRERWRWPARLFRQRLRRQLP